MVADENCRPFTDDRKRINWYYSLELKNSQFLDLYASAGRCFIANPRAFSFPE